jgi:diaminopimelate decarboxylase
MLADESSIEVVTRTLEQRAAILAAAAERPTPFYLFDGAALRDSLAVFARAFDAHLPGHRPFYAVKSNHHPRVVEEAARAGFGLDVSSGRELAQALAIPGCSIVFSGPAKSRADLDLALAHADRVMVHMDSFRELERLGEASASRGQSIRAGVRITTDHHGTWSKFGIPLGDLGRFARAARAHPRVSLQAVQLHSSWNRSADRYEKILADLGRTLAADLTAEERASIAIIDVGGGYQPHRLTGEYAEGSPEAPGRPHTPKESIPVEAYAEAIGRAAERHLAPLGRFAYYTEPGRVVSASSMHIVLSVVDKKGDDLVIVDGGINMVGWERYLHVYCPVVNLSRPSLREIPVRIGGSLCDCEDIWGFSCFGEGIEEGDVLVIPHQGAYSYCVAQEFIRPIPEIVELG